MSARSRFIPQPLYVPLSSIFMVKERKGLASGLLLGLFIGIVFDNIALGIIGGLLFGGAFDHHQKPKSDEPD